MSADKKKAPASGNAEAKSAGEKVLCAENHSTSNDELTWQVDEVERRYFTDNPLLGLYFIDYAKDCAEHGKRFSVYEPAEWLRWHRLTDSHGMDSAVNNSDLPIISRLLVEKVPECAELLEQRSSKYDPVFAERSGRG